MGPRGSPRHHRFAPPIAPLRQQRPHDVELFSGPSAMLSLSRPALGAHRATAGIRREPEAPARARLRSRRGERVENVFECSPPNVFTQLGGAPVNPRRTACSYADRGSGRGKREAGRRALPFAPASPGDTGEMSPDPPVPSAAVRGDNKARSGGVKITVGDPLRSQSRRSRSPAQPLFESIGHTSRRSTGEARELGDMRCNHAARPASSFSETRRRPQKR